MSDSDLASQLSQLLSEIRSIKLEQKDIAQKVESILQEKKSSPDSSALSNNDSTSKRYSSAVADKTNDTPIVSTPSNSTSPPPSPSVQAKKDLQHGQYPSRVILTTYPGQLGINPVLMDWYNQDPNRRGPVIASRHANSIKRRNAIGAYSGGYSIYRALAEAMGSFDPNFVPSYENTEPAFEIPYNPAWSTKGKIVALDPWGHMAPSLWRKEFESGLDIRPTIAITRAHLKVSELDQAAREGRIKIDGKIVIPSTGNSKPSENTTTDNSPSVTPSNSSNGQDNNKDVPIPPEGIEVNVGKAAVEPVWYLPGVADRFGISEDHLRRSLFESTGGSYPELLTRNDLKLFLPPIGGLTVYIFGNPAHLRNPEKELTLRIHDECNGSDVFGSDICTCRPYLLYGIEEAIKCAQRGGVGLVIYFRKEGRSLGEVTKYLVYNARKRGGDSAATYFKRTQDIAGVKDMRFQALSTDVLHWLGIKKIDNMISMSDMKYNAIVNSGIPILERYDLPESLIPPDSMVEIDAKIAAGYFSASKHLTESDLSSTVGRSWDPLQWDDLSH